MKRLALPLTLLALFVVAMPSLALDRSYQDQPLEFYIVFEDAQEIAVAAPVVFAGVTIGDVTDVVLIPVSTPDSEAPCVLDAEMVDKLDEPQVACVSVRIDATNRSMLTEESDFLIRRPILGILDQKHIEIKVWDNASQPMSHGATVMGRESVLDMYLNRLGDLKDKGLILGELTIRTEFDVNGAATRTYLLETSKLLPTHLVINGLVPQGEGWEVSEPEMEDSRLLESKRIVTSVESLSGTNSDIDFRIDGTTYTYTETFHPGQLETSESAELSIPELLDLASNAFDQIKEQPEDILDILGEVLDIVVDAIKGGVIGAVPRERIMVTVVVQMPGEFQEDGSNADYVVEKQVGDETVAEAIWISNLEELEDTRSPLVAVAKRGIIDNLFGSGEGKAPAGIIAGGIGALVLAGGAIAGGIYLYRRRLAGCSPVTGPEDWDAWESEPIGPSEAIDSGGDYDEPPDTDPGLGSYDYDDNLAYDGDENLDY